MLECNISYIANYILIQTISQESYSDCTQEKKKLRIVQYLNYSNCTSFSSWDQGQTDIKLETKHVIY